MAGIVKLDDAGLYLVRESEENTLKRSVGNGLVAGARWHVADEGSYG